MSDMLKKFIFILFAIILSFKLNGNETGDYKLTDEDINSIYDFATLSSIGIIFHEIGHLVGGHFINREKMTKKSAMMSILSSILAVGAIEPQFYSVLLAELADSSSQPFHQRFLPP